MKLESELENSHDILLSANSTWTTFVAEVACHCREFPRPLHSTRINKPLG
jgi:hypothetical protein